MAFLIHTRTVIRLLYQLVILQSSRIAKDLNLFNNKANYVHSIDDMAIVFFIKWLVECSHTYKQLEKKWI